MPKKVPWRERCSYLSPAETKCESVTPRGWTHRPTHTTKPGELLEETTGSMIREVELPALSNQSEALARPSLRRSGSVCFARLPGRNPSIHALKRRVRETPTPSPPLGLARFER